MAGNDLARGFYQDTNPDRTQIGPSAETAGATIIIDTGDDGDLSDLIDGTLKTELADGGVDIDLEPPRKKRGDETFDSNLAEYLPAGELARITTELLEAIEADDRSRQEWLENRAAGIEMLGFKVDKPRADSGTAPVEGMSTVRNPLLSEAVIRFQSNAAPELYPAEGPCKVRSDAPPAPPGSTEGEQNAGMGGNNPPDEFKMTKSDLAEALEKDFNHYLTVTDKGYRPDSVRNLFWIGFGGCGFKKVYNDPIRRRPVSRSVDAADLIVSNSANDIDDAGRITHRIMMRKSTLKRMQIAGIYRKVEMFASPQETPTAVEEKIAQVQGFEARPSRQEDQEFTVYECYCELDIEGYEHEDDDGNPTGLQLPYRVTIEKDSREILEIRRNWREDDETMLAKKVFVKFSFVPAMGFYDTGLLQIVGNTTKALTGAWRVMLDTGMFSNFPGFLYADTAGRQVTNEFRVPPGGGVKIQTGGKAISDVVMPLPYKDVGQGLMLLAKAIEESGQRVGGTAELQVAEGRQDAPVGTTLAMIEQATKMLAAVHINLHAAQSEELQLLKECFQEDPEAFWRHNKRPARQWEIDEFIQALNDTDLVPAADPNTPSHMHRIMKAMAIAQMAQAAPQLYDLKAVAVRIMRMLGIDDLYGLLSNQPPQPPQGPPPDPIKMAELQLKAKTQAQEAQDKQEDQQQQIQADQQESMQKANAANSESADRAADRASRERVAQSREETERLKLIGMMGQSGLIDPAIAAAAATGRPVQQGNSVPHAGMTAPHAMPQQAPAPVHPGLTPAKPGTFADGGAVVAEE